MMALSSGPNFWRAITIRTVIPVGLTIALLIGAFVLLIVPMFERSLMEAKRETVMELVNTVHADLVHRQLEVETGEVTLEEAQARAIARVRSLNYGPEKKDYFWINNMEPRMIMHPYRSDLEGEDISDLVDPLGKPLFSEFVRAVEASDDGAGFVDYMWQWKDDPTRVVPKISYVKLFEPWGWIIGTGIYIDDVQLRIAAITDQLNRAIVIIMAILIVISAYITWQSSIVEKQRSHAEEGLRSSEARYRSLTENIPDIITRFDRNCRVLYIGPSAESVFEIPLSDFIGKTYRELGFDIRQCEFNEKKVGFVFSTGEHVQGEYECNTPQGSVILNSRLVPETDERGEIKSVLAVSRDVTAHRRSEEKYRMLFTRMLSGFALHEIICDSDGNPIDYRFLAVNPAFESILNMSADDVIGRTVKEMFPATEHYWIETYGQVALTGEPCNFEQYSIALDKYFEVVAFQAKPGQFACIFQDISDRRRSEHERERLLKALSAKNEELESIVYVASHDLRSPLVNIDGYSREVEERFEELKRILAEFDVSEGVKDRLSALLDCEIPQALDFITSSSLKMDLLLRGLLRLSRLGQASLNIAALDMNQVLCDVQRAMQYQIRAAGVEVEVADLPGCMADAGQVSQVFTNLLDNAIKYLDRRRAGKIRVTSNCEDGMVVYCVEDNGIGISPAFCTKIFEVFHRLSPNSPVSGEGLGLTIVRRIVERLDGKVWVESEEGVGSRFYVALPQTEDDLRSK